MDDGDYEDLKDLSSNLVSSKAFSDNLSFVHTSGGPGAGLPVYSSPSILRKDLQESFNAASSLAVGSGKSISYTKSNGEKVTLSPRQAVIRLGFFKNQILLNGLGQYTFLYSKNKEDAVEYMKDLMSSDIISEMYPLIKAIQKSKK